MLRFLESPKWLLKMGRTQQANEVFSRIFNTDIAEGRDEMNQEISIIKEAMDLEDLNAYQYVKYKELLLFTGKLSSLELCSKSGNNYMALIQ